MGYGGLYGDCIGNGGSPARLCSHGGLIEHFKERNTAMKNIDKYDLRTALVAYNGEMTERSNHGIEGLPFEDWVEEDVDTTAKLIAEKKREEEAAKKAGEEEKEAIRKGMEELKKFYKDAGWEKAKAALDKIYALDPNYDVFENYGSACNVFHSGAWSVMCDDFVEVYDFYGYLKREAYNETISTPSDWLAYMKKGIPEAIEAWLKDADTIIKDLEAKGGAK